MGSTGGACRQNRRKAVGAAVYPTADHITHACVDTLTFFAPPGAAAVAEVASAAAGATAAAGIAAGAAAAAVGGAESAASSAFRFSVLSSMSLL